MPKMNVGGRTVEMGTAQIELCESVIDNCDMETLDRLILRAKKRKVNTVLRDAEKLAIIGDREAYIELVESVANDCDQEDLQNFARIHPANPDTIMGMVPIFGGELVKSMSGINFSAVEKKYGADWHKLNVDIFGNVVDRA